MRGRVFAALALLIALRVWGADDPGLPSGYVGLGSDEGFPADERQLASIRLRGDLEAERAHMWRLFSALSRTSLRDELPVFLTWFGAGEVFDEEAPLSQPRNLAEAMSLPHSGAKHASDGSSAPLIIRAQFNWSAYRHIRDNHLYKLQQLTRSSASLAGDMSSSGAVPEFPRSSVVVKTAWWPVPAKGSVALPVWDPALNRPRRGGNDYLSWPRVVAVSQGGTRIGSSDVELLGKDFRDAQQVDIDAFYHLMLDERLAQQLNDDPVARKAAVMLLGRPLKCHDALILIAMHVATRELADWIWGTFWWHDRPTIGQKASLRPGSVPGPYRNYLMDVSFDAELPRESDGSPHIAFNPYLEGRFADNGNGGGVVSNCVACHLRASTALARPFEVTRGRPPDSIVTTEQPSVSTSLLWSLALQAH